MSGVNVWLRTGDQLGTPAQILILTRSTPLPLARSLVEQTGSAHLVDGPPSKWFKTQTRFRKLREPDENILIIRQSLSLGDLHNGHLTFRYLLH